MGATLQVLKLSCNRKSLNANKFWFWSTSILEIMATKYVGMYIQKSNWFMQAYYMYKYIGAFHILIQNKNYWLFVFNEVLMHHLKEEGNRPWCWVSAWFFKLEPGFSPHQIGLTCIFAWPKKKSTLMQKNINILRKNSYFSKLWTIFKVHWRSSSHSSSSSSTNLIWFFLKL